jgi:hypothetical protein
MGYIEKKRLNSSKRVSINNNHASKLEPDKELVRVLKEYLTLKRAKKTGIASEDYHKKIASNSSYNSRILDKIIFPAMANLTFFFKAVASHPELKERYDDNIKDLLGIRRNNPSDTAYAFMFESLISNILWVLSRSHKNDSEDFTLKLNHILQQIVWAKFSQRLEDTFGYNMTVHRTVTSDFDRVEGWTSMAASNVKDEYDLSIPSIYKMTLTQEQRRGMDISTEEQYQAEQNRRKKENKKIFQIRNKNKKSIKANSPDRTFDIESTLAELNT